MKFGTPKSVMLSSLIGLYLSIGPVYWLPWVSQITLAYAKLLILSIAILATTILNSNVRGIPFPGGSKSFILFLSYLVLNVPGVAFGTRAASIYRMTNTLEIFAFLFISGWVIRESGHKLALKIALHGFLIFSGVSLVMIILHPDMANPFNGGLSIANTGFAGSRVGWSPANALQVPWTLVSGAYFGGIYGQIFALVTLLSNEISVDGRAGLLASFLAISGMVLYKRNFIAIAIWILVIIMAIKHYDILGLLRAPEVLEGHISLVALNQASEGRVDMIFASLRSIEAHPFLGTGFGNVTYGPLHYAVHNDFLLLASEGGVFCGITALAIAGLGLWRGYHYAITGGRFAQAIFLTLVVGFFVAQFEPGFIFGDFNTSAFWWFCYSICLSAGTKNFDQEHK